MSGTLKADLMLQCADVTLETKSDLTGSLDVLVENWLLLTTKTLLLTVVTTLTLCDEGGLTSLLLPGDTVQGVGLTLLTVCLLLLWEVDLIVGR